jgi:hypothetical protein
LAWIFKGDFKLDRNGNDHKTEKNINKASDMLDPKSNILITAPQLTFIALA